MELARCGGGGAAVGRSRCRRPPAPSASAMQRCRLAPGADPQIRLLAVACRSSRFLFTWPGACSTLVRGQRAGTGRAGAKSRLSLPCSSPSARLTRIPSIESSPGSRPSRGCSHRPLFALDSQTDLKHPTIRSEANDGHDAVKRQRPRRNSRSSGVVADASLSAT